MFWNSELCGARPPYCHTRQHGKLTYVQVCSHSSPLTLKSQLHLHIWEKTLLCFSLLTPHSQLSSPKKIGQPTRFRSIGARGKRASLWRVEPLLMIFENMIDQMITFVNFPLIPLEQGEISLWFGDHGIDFDGCDDKYRKRVIPYDSSEEYIEK